MKRLILMQGAPGSGKSTMARIIRAGILGQCQIFSTDEFWYQENPNVYSFDPDRHAEAHRWNQQRVAYEMANGFYDTIIVDNTNTQRWEVEPYLALAQIFEYEPMVVRVDPGVEECVARNAQRPKDRQVPEDVVRKMHARMEPLLAI